MRRLLDLRRRGHQALILARHFSRVLRAGQLRFRLETFGLYYPALPYQAPWWHISPRSLLLLLRQGLAYMRWVIEMEELRQNGPSAWWATHRPQKGSEEK